MIESTEVKALQRDVERYRWLRTHVVRIQGRDVWYVVQALDYPVAEQAKAVNPGKTPTRSAARAER